ncbi:MAG: diadenylate cyclase [Deltaproteobacteria bacterium]|nr:diadenylate cyclase [Deltaproteobacteria bacterium]
MNGDIAERLFSLSKDYFGNLIKVFRFADLIDIAIIAALTYVVLIWFKKTTSRFVLIGIVILGAIYSSARFFSMYLTEYVFQGFFAILLIAMVIIFQEDLRRFFERLAMWGFFKRQGERTKTDELIDTLVRTATSLAQKRYGALLVLPGKDYLDRHIEVGTELDGTISEPLLESLFDPHSIGHDGAAIIENGRVTKFGCHLPLSSNTKKLHNLGLRHTAALGLSERTDALCIVISEERGTISVAQEENLRRLTSPDQLRTILERFYHPQSPKETRTKIWVRWIKENPFEKALAVALASVLWLAFAYQTESIRRDFVIPIEYRNLQSSWIIEEPKTKEASITLVGSQQAFNLLDPQTLKIVVDMSALKEGRQALHLSRDLVRSPSNLSVLSIQPDQIRITARQMVATAMPVKVETTGTVHENLVVRSVEPKPPAIQVLALPKNHKHLVAVTEPIDLSVITSSTIVEPRIIFPPDIQFPDGKPPAVRVVITIESKKEPK